MPRARPLPPEDRRALLIVAAREIFAQRGYHNASVSDIIENADVARGTFYNYFESKRAIFQAVLDEIVREVFAAVEPIDVVRPIAPQVRGMLAAIVETVTEPSVSRLLFTEAVGIDTEGDDAIRSFYDAVTLRLEAALRAGRNMGVVAPGDLRMTARCLIGLIKEPVFQASLHNEQVDADALIDELFRILTRGALT